MQPLKKAINFAEIQWCLGNLSETDATILTLNSRIGRAAEGLAQGVVAGSSSMVVTGKHLAEGNNSQVSGKQVVKQKTPTLKEKTRYPKRHSIHVTNPFNKTYHSLYTLCKGNNRHTKGKENI